MCFYLKLVIRDMCASCRILHDPVCFRYLLLMGNNTHQCCVAAPVRESTYVRPLTNGSLQPPSQTPTHTRILSHFCTPTSTHQDNPVAAIMVRQVKLIIHGGLNPASPLIVIVEFSQLVIQCNWGATHSIHVCLTSANGGNDKGFPDVMTTWVKRVNAGLEIWPAKRKEVVG